MTSDQIVSAVRAHLDRTEEIALALHLRTCGHDVVTADAACDCDWHVSSVLSLTAAIRKLLAEYEEAATYYDQYGQIPAGEVHGLWTAIKILAQGLGIDTDKEITE